MKFDFSGYATKNNLKCSDGRIIRQDAFRDNDGQTVPLVWQHMHNEPSNVLGHVLLENRSDGVYAYAKFNDTPTGETAKSLVLHGDVKALSIYANNLVHKGADVIHGAIREVSLVLSGANPGAHIDPLTIMHADGSTDTTEDEAIIYTGLDLSIIDELKHADENDDVKEEEETMAQVFDSLTPKQKDLVYAMIAQVANDKSIAHDAFDKEEEINPEDEQSEEEEVEVEDEEFEDDEDEEFEDAEDEEEDDYDDEEEEEEEEITHFAGGEHFMKKNVFEQDNDSMVQQDTLSHAQFSAIVDSAQKFGSFKESFLSHVDAYGITNIGHLFPDPKVADSMPSLIAREMEWVGKVMAGVKNTPFSRIKSVAFDITAEEARALGYVKGSKKKDEVVRALKRTTLPSTIYKKQRLDRDDIIDITSLDVVAWLKKEMRMLLDEELARAILIGDGRALESDDKISEEHIRPIYKDDELYAHPVLVDNTTILASIDDIIRSRKHYKGSGSPTLYVNGDFLTDMLLLKDKQDRYIYNNETDLAVKLRVSNIVEVPVMENILRVDATDAAKSYELLGLIVNLKDYRVGADRGGEVSMFDDFDIDYNQHKYLIETRCSGALVQPKAALVLERVYTDPQ